jgi:hypothetical protein
VSKKKEIKEENVITASSLLPKVEEAPKDEEMPPSLTQEVPAFKADPALPEALQEKASDLVLVKLRAVVIINGQRFEPGWAELPKDAYDCWKHAV